MSSKEYKNVSREEYEEIKAKYKEYKAIYKSLKEQFKDKDKDKDKDEHKHKDCGCGDKNCDCGDDCKCTPEDNCGCDCGKEHKHKDCGCGDKNCDCGDDCKCTPEDNCGCDCGSQDDDHCHCGCKHTHGKLTEDDLKHIIAEFQIALQQAEKEITKLNTQAMDNQRIAVTYKKDLERYKERNANIQEEAQNNAVETVANELIPIIDQFETALKATQQTPERKGFEMIYASLKKSVTDLGIAEIDALGKTFDTNYHNAVSKTGVSDKKKDGVVTAVYQKGYYLIKTNKVIRYAMVEIGEYVK